ncbi:MFS transporter [Stygiolobus caldivivus]|uniref:MFS transporter n=1 Tax=Stygiolobus caldivivus TaxID=2824673 RepID=A0A8D5ZJR4_9CREN|nr:MFS transporter [Stygiolobus caldivivus]BCU70906.1 MFS transporter [Stygiolobus caldivivus]
MIKYKDTRWMWLVLPFNASTGSLSTLITLQILTLGGNALDVSFALSLSNAVLIPSSLFWGFMADRMDRKKQILISMGGTSASLLLMPLANSIPLLAINYSLITFMSTASTTPFNLLVMESAEKKHWGQLFSRFSFLSSMGMLTSLILSTILVVFLKIYEIEEILGIIALATLIAGIKLIPRPILTFERVAILHHKESFLTRMRHLPMMFLHIPNPHSFKIFSWRRIKTKPTNYIPLLYLGIVTFYISSGIFNTVYPAGLYVKGLDKSGVLTVITVGMVFQIIGFKVSGLLLEKAEEKKIAYLSLLLRGLSYSVLGVFAQVFFGLPIFISGLIFYPLAAGIAYSLFYSSSTTLVFKIVGERSQGKGLGVYSTVVGVSLFLGSLLSGYFTHYIGYGVDFMIAGSLLVIDAILFKYLEEG